MKIFSIIAGVLLVGLGGFAILNGGLPFTSLAFPIGIILMLVGIVECLAYKKTAETEENKHWIFIDGLTTFIVGIITISGYISIDHAVIVLFAMWSLVSGIRVVGIAIEDPEFRGQEKNLNFYWKLAVGILNFIVGLACFYNPLLLHLAVLTLVGICCIIQGANVIRISTEIPYVKPDLIKSKDEKIADAKADAKAAKEEFKAAVQNLREAKEAVREAKEAPDFEEIISEPAAEPIVEIISNITSDSESADTVAEEEVSGEESATVDK